MVKKRLKKLFASALAVSMAATLLPSAAMASGDINNDVIEDSVPVAQDTSSFVESGNRVHNLLLSAKASSETLPSTMQGIQDNKEKAGYVQNRKCIENITADPDNDTITVYGYAEGMSDYAPAKGSCLYAIVMDCDSNVNRVEGKNNGKNYLNVEPLILANGTSANAIAGDSDSSGQYISMWNYTEQNPATIKLVQTTSTNRNFQTVSINFKTPVITMDSTKEMTVGTSVNAADLVSKTDPENSKVDLSFFTSDSNIVKKDGSKLVAKGPGTATITASMNCGVTATCKVTVTQGTEEEEETPAPTETPDPSVSGDATVTPDPSVSGDATVTPDPSVSGDATITPDPSQPGDDVTPGPDDPTVTVTVTPTPEPVQTGDKVKTEDGNTVVVTDTDNNTVAFTAADTTAKTVEIPKKVEIEGVPYKVTKIENNAFANNKTVTAVTIPTTITEIGKNAFKNCTKLSSVTVPKNVTSVGAGAFQGCKKLTKVTVNATKLTTIKASAFNGCTALKTVVLPKKVTTIKKSAFAGCKNLKKLTIKSTTTLKVTKGAFKGVTKKAVIKVPSKKVKAFSKTLKKAGFKGKVKAI